MKLSHFVTPSTLDRVQAEAVRNDASKLLDYCRWYRRCVLPDLLHKEQTPAPEEAPSPSAAESIESTYYGDAGGSNGNEVPDSDF